MTEGRYQQEGFVAQAAWGGAFQELGRSHAPQGAFASGEKEAQDTKDGKLPDGTKP